MSTSLWLAVLAVAMGTFCLRALPMVWMRRYFKKYPDKEALDAIPEWLSILGPLMIAAMFGVSLIPHQAGVMPWFIALLGCLATVVTWKYTRSIGLPVCVGVAFYGFLYAFLF